MKPSPQPLSSVHSLQSSARTLEEPLCKHRRRKPLQEAAPVASPLHRPQALAHGAGKGAFLNLLTLISLLISFRPQDLLSLGDMVFLLNLAATTINSFHLECFPSATQLIVVTALTGHSVYRVLSPLCSTALAFKVFSADAVWFCFLLRLYSDDEVSACPFLQQTLS